MKIKHFADTDTLYIELKNATVADTRDIDEDTLVEYDTQGNLCAITIEHARQRADFPQFSFEQVAS